MIALGMLGVLGTVLVGVLVAAWRWADRTSAVSTPPTRSEDLDPYRSSGL